MSRGWLVALGFYLISSGSAGYERYMLQGDVSAATVDALLSCLGVWLLARGLDRP